MSALISAGIITRAAIEQPPELHSPLYIQADGLMIVAYRIFETPEDTHGERVVPLFRRSITVVYNVQACTCTSI